MSDTSVSSPTGAVTVSRVPAQGIRVSLDPDRRSAHDEHSLAEEIEAAIAALDEKRAQERAASMRSLVSDEVRESQRSPLSERDKEFIKLVKSAEGNGRSDDGHVEVFAFGDGDLIIRFYDNVIRDTTVATTALAAEVNQSLKRAMQDLGKKVKIARATLSRLMCVGSMSRHTDRCEHDRYPGNGLLNGTR